MVGQVVGHHATSLSSEVSWKGMVERRPTLEDVGTL